MVFEIFISYMDSFLVAVGWLVMGIISLSAAYHTRLFNERKMSKKQKSQETFVESLELISMGMLLYFMIRII